MATKINTGAPKNPAAAVDELYKLKSEKSAINAEVKRIEDREKELKDYLIEKLPKDDATGVSGKLAVGEVVTKVVPTVKDWEKLYAYIKKHGAWDLLKRAVNTKAAEDRWGDKQNKLPGVEAFTVVSVSIRKKG